MKKKLQTIANDLSQLAKRTIWKWTEAKILQDRRGVRNLIVHFVDSEDNKHTVCAKMNGIVKLEKINDILLDKLTVHELLAECDKVRE